MGSNTLIQFKNGAAAELYAAARLADLGKNILYPFCTQSRYDFVIEEEGFYAKVQVKRATLTKTGKYQYLQARISGKNKLTNTPYTADDVEWFAFTDMNKVWMAPFDEVGHLTSVCLGSTNPNYKPQTAYKSEAWLIG